MTAIPVERHGGDCNNAHVGCKPEVASEWFVIVHQIWDLEQIRPPLESLPVVTGGVTVLDSLLIELRVR